MSPREKADWLSWFVAMLACTLFLAFAQISSLTWQGEASVALSIWLVILTVAILGSLIGLAFRVTYLKGRNG